MKFVPKKLLTTKDISAGEGGQVRELLKLAALALSIIGAIYLLVGVFVDVVVMNISVAQEKKMFGGITSFGGEAGKKTIQVAPRLKKILARLIAVKGVPPLDYKLTIIHDPKPNAFALPGGLIVVTSGLQKELTKDIPLAFVLGHELGHFKNRDHLRGLGRAMGYAVCKAFIFGNNSSGNLLAGNSLALLSRRYSRGQEAAADRFGVTLVYRAFGKTAGVTRLFELLVKKGGQNGFTLLSSHPAPEDRIAKLKTWVAELERNDSNGKKSKTLHEGSDAN